MHNTSTQTEWRVLLIALTIVFGFEDLCWLWMVSTCLILSSSSPCRNLPLSKELSNFS